MGETTVRSSLWAARGSQFRDVRADREQRTIALQKQYRRGPGGRFQETGEPGEGRRVERIVAVGAGEPQA